MAHQDDHEEGCKCAIVNELATDYAVSFSQDCDIVKLTGDERMTAIETMLTILVATIVKEGHEDKVMASLDAWLVWVISAHRMVGFMPPILRF